MVPTRRPTSDDLHAPRLSLLWVTQLARTVVVQQANIDGRACRPARTWPAHIWLLRRGPSRQRRPPLQPTGATDFPLLLLKVLVLVELGHAPARLLLPRMTKLVFK